MKDSHLTASKLLARSLCNDKFTRGVITSHIGRGSKGKTVSILMHTRLTDKKYRPKSWI